MGEPVGTRFLRRDEGRRLRLASVWLLVMAFGFAAHGAWEIRSNRARSTSRDEARQVIAARARAEEVAARPWRQGDPPPEELRAVPSAEQVARAKAVLARPDEGAKPGRGSPWINFGCSGFMLAMFLWARRAPIFALATALVAYLALLTVSAILVPESVVISLVEKVLGVGGLIIGLGVALQRRVRQRSPT